MDRKELMDSILSRVAEDKREAFISDFREAKSKDARKDVLKKYDIILTKEDIEILQANREVSDNELDTAAGGCCMNSCSKACYVRSCSS